MCLHNPSEITKSGRIEVRILLKFAYIVITPIPLVPGDDYQLYVESTRRTFSEALETRPSQVGNTQDGRRSTCKWDTWSGRLIVGAGVARLAVVLAHRGEGHGLVYFALGFASFVAPAGASCAMIRAPRTRVALPGLLLRGHDVAAVAVLLGAPLFGLCIIFIAPANVP